MDRKAPIGVIDSGVGGLSVLKCLHKSLPHEDFIYLGDTARTPYGTRSEAEVRRFVGEMLAWLDGQGVKLTVIACNTLTVLGVDTLQAGHAFLLVGMSKGERLVLQNSRNKKIGVLATQFTIGTAAHKRAITACDPEAQVFGQACPDFVPLIEGVRFGSAELLQAVDKYTAPLRQAGVDTVLLSCTHYPFIKQEIEAAMGGAVTVLDPAEETAAQAAALLEARGLLRAEGRGRVTVCCTAELARVRTLAARMLPVKECEFAEIVL